MAEGRGRPSLYTDELGDKVCEGIAQGNSLTKLCKADDMPAERTVYKWRREIDVFMQNYTRAREDAADFFVEEIMEIADAAEAEDVQVAKLRVDTRKWTAARFNRAYQDRQTTEIEVTDSVAERILRARSRSGSDTEE
jgi:hypothetical protein